MSNYNYGIIKDAIIEWYEKIKANQTKKKGFLFFHWLFDKDNNHDY